MAPPILILKDVRYRLGASMLLNGVDLQVSPGDRIALVGRNGSGKSTLMRMAAGTVEPDAGTLWADSAATVRYLPQEPDFGGAATTLAYVEAGLGPADDPHRALQLLNDLGLTGEEDPKRLSGGEARRAAIARTLAPEPDLLLLDEPTNHLDIAAIEWLEATLSSMRSAFVLVSHDRRFLARTTRQIVWIDRGATRRLDRGFAAFEEWRDQVFAEEERDRERMDKKLAQEADWLRYGVTARRKRNVRRLGELYALRAERKALRGPQGSVELAVAEAGRSGKLVVVADHVSKSYGGTPVVRDFSIRIARGDRLGIVGPNGAGKTTLVKLLTGTLAPDEGTVTEGTRLETATLDQSRAMLDPEWTLAEALTGGRGDTVFVGGVARHVVAYMQDFLFSPEQARTPVKVLSGGERGRLMLARALAAPSNLLVLDEPTNDLDLETLDVLEERLAAYTGTVILVSHDREFLDRIVTSVVVAEGEGRFVEYAGGYSDMLAQRGRDLAGRPAAGDARSRDGAREAVPAPRPKPARPRLTFKDRHALEKLPGEMAALEKRAAAAEKLLADPGLYARDHAAFARAEAEHAAARAALAAAEEEWLRLEMLREEAEGG